MNSQIVYHYEAFSSRPRQGNPAGIVLTGEELTESQMQGIATKVGFNETAFVLPSAEANYRIRYFTPGHEVNLCGHATIATLYALHSRGLLGELTELNIETKAGILPIRITRTSDQETLITMTQAAPQFRPFKGSQADLAASLGIEQADFESRYPIIYGNTGIWTLLVPIKRLDVFRQMSPDSKRFPDILKEIPGASVHPFCLETYDPLAHMHARHFSSPYSGTIEDPVTGTASGVMGAYYAAFVDQSGQPLELLVEQGQEIGRDGRVRVNVNPNGKQEISISGTAVFVEEMSITVGGKE